MTTTKSLNQIIRRYKDSLIDGDQKNALASINLALANGSDVKTVYKKVFTSAQRDIGQMWHDGEISIMMEGWRVDYLTNHNINKYQIPNDDFIRYVNEIKPKLFAISVATDMAFVECNKLTDFFKNNFPHIKVIWGGPGVSRSLNTDKDIDFNQIDGNLSEYLRIKSKPDFICCSNSAFESKECKSFLSRSMNHSDVDSVDDTLAKIGNNIKTLRISKGVSQQELANMASIDRAFISTIENGKRNLSVSVLHKIATNLDSNISEIFRD